MLVFRIMFFILIAISVFYGMKYVLFKFLSLDEKVKDLKEMKEDVRSSFSDAEKEIVSKRKSLKEARKQL